MWRGGFWAPQFRVGRNARVTMKIAEGSLRIGNKGRPCIARRRAHDTL
jgi:hypothetical protein